MLRIMIPPRTASVTSKSNAEQCTQKIIVTGMWPSDTYMDTYCSMANSL